MDTFDFIMQHSETAQMYQNITVMAWAHSILYKDDDSNCFMSSKDLHYQYELEKRYQNIQAMVVQVSGNHVKNFEMYNLTDDGQGQLLKCHKKPGTTHGSCSKKEFYTECNYSFQDMELNITDFTDFSQNLPFNPELSYDENLMNLDGMDDTMDDENNVTFIYPKKMISNFEAKAKKYDVEIMAYVVGYRDNDVLTATELIYPNQTGTEKDVNDRGMINDFRILIIKKFFVLILLLLIF